MSMNTFDRDVWSDVPGHKRICPMCRRAVVPPVQGQRYCYVCARQLRRPKDV